MFTPKPYTRNVLSNMVMLVPETLSQIYSVPIDKLIGHFSKKRTSTLKAYDKESMGIFFKGFSDGMVETVKDMKAGVNTYEAFGQYELRDSDHLYRTEYFRGQYIGKLLNNLIQTSGYVLTLGDRPFTQDII